MTTTDTRSSRTRDQEVGHPRAKSKVRSRAIPAFPENLRSLAGSVLDCSHSHGNESQSLEIRYFNPTRTSLESVAPIRTSPNAAKAKSSAKVREYGWPAHRQLADFIFGNRRTDFPPASTVALMLKLAKVSSNTGPFLGAMFSLFGLIFFGLSGAKRSMVGKPALEFLGVWNPTWTLYRPRILRLPETLRMLQGSSGHSWSAGKSLVFAGATISASGRALWTALPPPAPLPFRGLQDALPLRSWKELYTCFFLLLLASQLLGSSRFFSGISARDRSLRFSIERGRLPIPFRTKS